MIQCLWVSSGTRLEKIRDRKVELSTVCLRCDTEVPRLLFPPESVTKSSRLNVASFINNSRPTALHLPPYIQLLTNPVERITAPSEMELPPFQGWLVERGSLEIFE
jgi:hypothetical protein